MAGYQASTFTTVVTSSHRGACRAHFSNVTEKSYFNQLRKEGYGPKNSITLPKPMSRKKAADYALKNMVTLTSEEKEKFREVAKTGDNPRIEGYHATSRSTAKKGRKSRSRRKAAA